MKVLITGGAGFIGSHVCEFLLNQKAEVTAVDNLITGSLENIQHLEGHTAFRFVEGDVKDKNLMQSLIQATDFIIHLAAPVGVKFIMNNPVHTILDCVHSTETLLEAALQFDKPVLIASTSEVYGKNLDLLDPDGHKRLKEDDYRIEGSSTNHRWAYANVKSLNEFLAFAYMRQFGLKIIITRFFNTAGARQRSEYGMVIPNFVQAAIRNQPLEVYGSGLQKRSFIHIQDTLQALWALMQNPQAFGQVFNIGNPDEISILELAKRIVHITGSDSEIKHVSYEEAYGDGFEEMNRRTADISRLQSLTGFEIRYNLDDILQDVIQFESQKAGIL